MTRLLTESPIKDPLNKREEGVNVLSEATVVAVLR
jgi:hypothetical protein